jgi:hypothetical protein
VRSGLFRGLGRRCVDWGLWQVVAEVEVRDEPVSQILGGEVVQGRHGQGSCDRSDVVSLIIDALQELCQCRPISLSEESLVELVGQGRPSLLRSDRGRFGQPILDLADALQLLGGGTPRVAVPVLDVSEQGLPDRWQGKVESGADGVAALVPTFRGAGGDDPHRLGLGLFGWQAGEPFLDEPFAERLRLVQHGSERCRT